MSAGNDIEIAVVYGAPTPPGRLGTAAAAVREAVTESGMSATEVDVHALGAALLGPPEGAEVAAAVATVEAADAVVFTSPVYRASMPGALKCLLDVLGVDALRNKPTGLVAMGGAPHHYLGVDGHLRDILAWFGALCAPTSIYLTGKSFDDGALGDEARAEVEALVATLRSLSTVGALGPEPLAASAW